MQKQNHYHDIKITTPWTVSAFVLNSIFLFSLSIFFICVPPYLVFMESTEVINEEIVEDGYVLFIIKLLINILVLIFYLASNYLLLGNIVVQFLDKIKLLLSSKTIRLESDQIVFIPTIKSFQREPIKLPSSLLELLVVGENLAKQPATLVNFIFISKNAPPLIFFSSKDVKLAEEIDLEIADFYQIKLTEKLHSRERVFN
jgi:hypothetical protein